ncbi:MAG TPA: hypothetical protein VIY29_24905, partial [Ktedonobacteraceae bacterium]
LVYYEEEKGNTASGQSKMKFTGLRAGRDMKGDYSDADVIAGCYTAWWQCGIAAASPCAPPGMHSELDASVGGARCSRRFWDQAEKRTSGGVINLGI